MKYSEILNLTVEELKKREKSMRDELFEIQMKHAAGLIGNPLKIRFLGRDIARVKTALTAKLT